MTLPTTVTFANDPVVLELAALTGRAAAALAGPKATFAELEEVGLAVSNEAVRVMLQTRLQAVADAHGKFWLFRGSGEAVFAGSFAKRPTLRLLVA